MPVDIYRRAVFILSALLICALGLVACGGGGGGYDSAQIIPPETTPFGLETRAQLASFTLPGADANTGSFALVNAFVNLSFSSPLFLSGIPGESRLVVVEQSGFIHAFDNNPNVSSSRIVLDLSGIVATGGEQGLLGLAFDPAFALNRYIYLHYSDFGPRRSVISRFSWNAATDVVDINSEKIILELNQPFTNHNGGMLAFGPDNFLYIAFGDGGSGGDPSNQSQDKSTLLGNILRIDVHPTNPADPYDIPLDNPFVSQSGIRPEIYASGLRNPFRFSFDRQTGDLWLGDVGQNNIEEIDLIVAGGNYGWRVFEGTQAFDDTLNTLPLSAFTPPVIEYDHSQGVAVIGGYVYRGNALPSLQGRYLYSDFGSGTVWALDYDGSNVQSNDIIATASAPTSFGEDNAGELYIVSRNGGIFKFEQTDGNANNIPDQLSETGIFTDLSTLTTASGLIEYSINQAFWSDGTIKRRWVGVPDNLKVQFSATDAWSFPLGTVVIKHFEIELTEGEVDSRRRLETRLLINSGDGWQGFTYRWNNSQTDADLLTGRESETININLSQGGVQTQVYDYPSRTDCLGCHTQAAGFTLGLNTRQINTDFDYPDMRDNQLRSLNNIGLFDSDIGAHNQYQAFPARDDTSRPMADRARSYLDVNCAQCHRPEGPTPVDLDLRFDSLDAQLNALDISPTAGDLNIANAQIIATGEKERSVLWQRMQRVDGERMPPLASHRVDSLGVEVVGQWIDTL